jgi:hypothetical protein
MEKFITFVGLDVHKNSIDVALPMPAMRGESWWRQPKLTAIRRGSRDHFSNARKGYVKRPGLLPGSAKYGVVPGSGD